MHLQYKSYKLWFLLLADMGIFAAGLYLAFLMRFDLNIPPEQVIIFKTSLPIFVITKLAAFYLFNLYRGMWRYTSIIDLFTIIKATFSAMLVSAAMLVFLYHGMGFPRTVFFLDFVFVVGMTAFLRISIRVVYHIIGNNFTLLSPFLYRRNPDNLKRIVIIGAGNTCENALRELLGDRHADFKIVGIFDDDRSKVGTMIRGITIVDTIENMYKYTDLFDEIIICAPNTSSEGMRHILDICQKTAKSYKIIPKMSEFINGKISIESAREITISDLIGREEIDNIDKSSVTKFIDGKTILITGAGGSIGSELVVQCLNFKPRELILLDISEYNMFRIEQLCQDNKTKNIIPILGDIRDLKILDFVFERYKCIFR